MIPKSKTISRALKYYRRKYGLDVDAPAGAHQVRGEKAARAKLTQKAVDQIRAERRKLGTSCAMLASKHGVSRQAIHAILTGRSWKPPISLDDFEF